MNTRQLLRNVDFRDFLQDEVMHGLLEGGRGDEIADYFDSGDALDAGFAFLAAIAQARQDYEDSCDDESIDDMQAEERRVDNHYRALDVASGR